MAPRASTVQVTGRVSKISTGGGDSVNAKILHNSTILFDRDAAYDADGQAHNRAFPLLIDTQVEAQRFELEHKDGKLEDSTGRLIERL